MPRPFLAIVSLIFLAASPATQPLLPAARALADNIRKPLESSRYMARSPGMPVTVPGWESFPTLKHTYRLADKKDGTVKEADVILLNPSAEQLALWIVTAIETVEGTYTPERGQQFFNHIRSQSGGQFPVAGIVYEDILPADGVYETFAFRDGVTVRLAGLGHRITTPLTAEQRQLSLAAPIEKVFTFARIASTSPKQWLAVHPEDKAILDESGNPTKAWPNTIRRAYQKAWTSPHNELIEAWLKANPPKPTTRP